MTNTLKVAVYSRVASADDDRIAGQEEGLLKFADRNGYAECTCYRDNGESGLSLNRPGMQRLINDIQGGRVGTVIVLDLNRIARGLQPMIKWCQLIEKHGVVFISTRGDHMYLDTMLRFWEQPITQDTHE